MSTHTKALAFLARHNVLTLATQGSEGPWAAAVFYVNDGFTFHFLSSPASRHAENLVADPRVAATIQSDDTGWRDIQGIQLEGEAEEVDGDERRSAVERYAAKFPVVRDPREPEIQVAMNKVAWYRLTPRRLYFIDNSVALGHRDEWRPTGVLAR